MENREIANEEKALRKSNVEFISEVIESMPEIEQRELLGIFMGIKLCQNYIEQEREEQKEG